MLSYPSRTGTFTALALPPLSPPDEWQVNHGATATTLAVVKGQPRLQCIASSGNLIFAWPTNSLPGYALQWASNLTPPIQWITLTDEPVVVGDQFQIVLPVGNGSGFYRLIK